MNDYSTNKPGDLKHGLGMSRNDMLVFLLQTNEHTPYSVFVCIVSMSIAVNINKLHYRKFTGFQRLLMTMLQGRTTPYGTLLL